MINAIRAESWSVAFLGCLLGCLAVDRAIAGRCPGGTVLRAVPRSAGAKLQRKLQWRRTYGHGRRHFASRDGIRWQERDRAVTQSRVPNIGIQVGACIHMCWAYWTGAADCCSPVWTRPLSMYLTWYADSIEDSLSARGKCTHYFLGRMLGLVIFVCVPSVISSRSLPDILDVMS